MPGQNVSAGPYQVLLTFSINYNVCAVGAAGLCLTPQTGTATTTILLNMTVTNDCSTMTTPDVNFNSAPLVQSFPTVSQAIAVTCTKGSTYTIGINNGANALNNVRRMVSGSNYMSYDIYKEATTNRWGSSGTERWTSATSSRGQYRRITAYLQLHRQSPDRAGHTPAGTYTDTLIVDVAF